MSKSAANPVALSMLSIVDRNVMGILRLDQSTVTCN